MNVGLNISNGEIRVLSTSGRKVKKWGRIELDEGLVRDGAILKPETVGATIRDLFKSTGIPREKVVVSLAGLTCTYRFLNLPRMKSSAREEAVLRAARQDISLPIEELYLSWQVIPGKGEDQTYFVVGVPRNLVNSLCETLRFAGVMPYLMDLRPLALARVANRSDAIIVNLEPDNSDIIFITNGVPAVIHTVSLKGQDATIEDNIRLLINELTKTVAFYQSSHRDEPLKTMTPLLLSGELAADTAVKEMLAAEFEYPVENLDPVADYPAGLPVESYASTIGLALKKLAPPGRGGKTDEPRFYDLNVNLLAGKTRRAKPASQTAGFIAVCAAVAIAAIFLFPLFQTKADLAGQNEGLQAQLQEINREINLRNLIAGESAEKEETIQGLLARATALTLEVQGLLGSRGQVASDLAFVTAAVPAQAEYTTLEIHPDYVVVTGQVMDVFSVVEYAAALEAGGIFQDVRIVDINEGESLDEAEGDNGEDAAATSVITFRIIAHKDQPGTSD